MHIYGLRALVGMMNFHLFAEYGLEKRNKTPLKVDGHGQKTDHLLN